MNDIDLKGVKKLEKILDKEKERNSKFSYLYDLNLRRLNIRGAINFPPIYEFNEYIEILDMSNGNLSDLPKDFYKMKNLKVGFFSNNDFKEIPFLAKNEKLKFLGMKSCKISSIPETALPKNLEWLTLTDNKIKCLPETIGDLKKLKKLLLSGNRLSELPKELLQCKNLELIRLSANNFKKSPLDWLINLPKLS